MRDSSIGLLLGIDAKVQMLKDTNPAGEARRRYVQSAPEIRGCGLFYRK